MKMKRTENTWEGGHGDDKLVQLRTKIKVVGKGNGVKTDRRKCEVKMKTVFTIN